jgi:DNA-directed RNA polymerase subunit RPC12/RpoP
MFVKNDESFICNNCNKKVEKLEYTSRDHCNHCLYCIHVDITPGDRINDCKGTLKPFNIEISNKSKGEVVIYKCLKCGKTVRNKVAEDDSKEVIYKIVENYAKSGGNLK